MRRVVMLILATALVVAGDVARAGSSQEPVRIPTMIGARSSASQVTVRPGDHLWKISARFLAVEDPESPVAPYWRSVIEENQADLRSGDPDLIYPGEIVRMPEPAG